MAECEVRMLRSEDCVEVAKLGQKFMEESPLYQDLTFDPDRTLVYVHSYVGEQKGVDSSRAGWVATMDGKIIAAMFARTYRMKWFKELFSMDDSLFVLPEYRGSGAGEMMLDAYIEWAKEKGAAKKMLGMSSGIKAAKVKAFYEANGFEVAGFLAQYIGD